jgi:hypothetical protein
LTSVANKSGFLEGPPQLSGAPWKRIPLRKMSG